MLKRRLCCLNISFLYSTPYASNRLAVKENKMKLLASDFPSFMFDMSKYDEASLKGSLLRGYLLIRVSFIILFYHSAFVNLFLGCALYFNCPVCSWKRRRREDFPRGKCRKAWLHVHNPSHYRICCLSGRSYISLLPLGTRHLAA